MTKCFEQIKDWIPLLLYKALRASGPKYISALLLREQLSRPPRLFGTGLLTVPRATTKHVKAAFGFYAPQTAREFILRAENLPLAEREILINLNTF